MRFTNSGTEANLLAISVARIFTKRKTVLVFDGAYHGAVFGFAGGGSPINAPFDYVLAPYNDIGATRALIAAHADDLALVILEPMIGSGGCIPARHDFLRMLRDETTRVGALLVFDEVMTSRLAPGGLQSVAGVKPDLTTLGKYIGGGMSFGAFGGRGDVMDLFDPRRPNALPHAGTFNNNVLTMSAGLAGLTQVYTPDAARALNARGEALRSRLNALCEAAGAPLQFTGIGSMLAVHTHARAGALPGGRGEVGCEAEGIVLLRYAGARHVAGAARHDDRFAADRRCRVRSTRGGCAGVHIGAAVVVGVGYRQ